MGIPKFYRWISERYPCLSQVVKDYQIPEFDNFYLDMNGIIHICSHPNDDDPTFRITEDKIFTEIFNYIEALFRTIKPRKVLFLAVDGVAPRAKMNQQRGRRFRSAREAQDVVRKALQKGTVLPSEPRFDSNCITPGTEFMVRLHEQLKYFVNQKVATDPSWQSVEVVLSGQEVPGEGEHKIMDYIRHQKAQPDYDPNTRHCLYGLDADLIMLGLVTHEPHFCLLREEVRFGKKNQKRHMSPSTVTFHLLHLTILREYIEHEFSSLKTSLPFPYSLESIIDDWVLLCFLVGNDFLPNLPNMHIKQSTLPYLYKKYTEVLPTLDGYINEGGDLNMRRFEAYLEALAEFDYDHYSELISDMKWMEAKTMGSKWKAKKKTSTKSFEGAVSGKTGKASSEEEGGGGGGGGRGGGGGGGGGEGGFEDVEEKELVGFFSGKDDDVSLDEESETTMKLKRDLGISSINAYFEKEDIDRIDSFEADLSEMKSRYYREKLGFIRIDSSVLAEQAKCYVVGVQWVLSYYYHGVPSWSWFYPYHYAPFVSDVRGFGDLQFEFVLGKPFFPFEQLLGVLPPASKSLLPRPFQALMMNDDSPIKDYYPVEFQTDLNGKAQEWEAVVLIPFIDEERLLAAMSEKNGQLTKEEVQRNVHGVCQVYTYDPELEASTYPSPWPQVFPDIAHCRVKCSELPAIPFLIARDELVQGLLPGVKLDIFFPGFPTLKHVPHTSTLEKRGVRVFQAASRDDNMCLTVKARGTRNKDLNKLANELVGAQCYVGWPYLSEAKVHAVSDGNIKYYADPNSRSKVKIVTHMLKEKEIAQWTADVTQVSRQYAEFRGIDIPLVDVLVYANVLQGKRYITDKDARGSLILHKEWRTLAEPHPYDLTVTDIAAHAPEYKERGITLEELFKPKDQCFLVANPHYGSQTEILSVDSAQLRVQVRVKLLPEPDIASVITNSYHLSIHYTPSYVVAQQLGLKGLVLSRISGNIQVERGSPANTKERERINIGLNLKFARRNKELPGYCRKTEEGWSYSPAAVELLERFMNQFPAIFNHLHANPNEDKYYESELLAGANGDVTLAQVQEWLKQLPISSMETVECGGQSLDEPQIAAVEKAIADMKQQKQKSMKAAKLRVKPTVLYLPSVQQGAIVPDPKAQYYLFDRVINVMPNTAVPFGLKGTVIGIQGDGSEIGTLYEVLFDDEFLGGLTLRCSPNRAYRLPPSCLLNLSFGARLKAGKNPAQRSQVSSRQQQGYSGSAWGQSSGLRGGTHSGVTSSDFPPLDPRDRGHAPFHHTQYRPHTSPHHQQHQQHYHPSTAHGYRSDHRYSPYYDEWDYHYDTPRRGGRGGRGGGWGGEGRGRMERERRGGGRGRGKQEGADGEWRREREGEWEIVRRGRGRDRGRGGRERDSTPRIITRVPKASTSPKKPGASNTHSGSHQQTSPSLSNSLQQQQSTERSDRNKQGNDTFFAALSALEKLDISSTETPSRANPPGSETRMSPGKQTSSKSSNKRDLSPSVAAVFDTIDAASNQQISSSLSPEVSMPLSVGRDGHSVTLKALLKMEEDRVQEDGEGGGGGEGGRGGGEGERGGAEEPSMPEAIQKLMQPMNLHPRGPLLPHPPYPHPHPLVHRPPPNHPQYFPAHQGFRPDYSSVPPPLMPFGPPPVDPLSTLQHTCQITGQPPPRFTTRQTEQGYVATVNVGKTKYNGTPCASQEEARQSAAAVMNAAMMTSTVPTAPMYFPMPYMGPPVPGPYSGPPLLPPHVPPYLPLPHTYHPRGPQPIVHQSNAPPSFVPLQVQRRQIQHPQHSFNKQDRPARSNSSSGNSRRNEPGKKRPVKEKRGKEDIAREDKPASTCITDDEKVQVERAKRSLQTPIDTVAPNDTVPLPTTREPSEGRSSESDSRGKVASTDAEQTIMKRLEVVEKERRETQQKIASLTQTLSIVRDPQTQVESPDVVAPVPENRTAATGGEEKVQSIDDVIAKAAIVSAMEVDIGDSDGDYQESVQSSDAMVPGGGGVGEVVHVVGEIIGGGGIGEAPVPSVPDVSVRDVTTQSGRDSVPQSYSSPMTEDHSSATTHQQVPKPTTHQTMVTASANQDNQPTTTTDQQVPANLTPLPPTNVTESVSSNPPSLPPPNVPSSATKTSRPKRQLAASFSKSTT